MERLMPTLKIGALPVSTTILICAADPAQRALARTSFAERGWYVVETGFSEIGQIARSVKIDVVVVISATEGATAMVRDAFASSRAELSHVVQVRHAAQARDEVRKRLGH